MLNNFSFSFLWGWGFCWPLPYILSSQQVTAIALAGYGCRVHVDSRQSLSCSSRVQSVVIIFFDRAVYCTFLHQSVSVVTGKCWEPHKMLMVICDSIASFPERLGHPNKMFRFPSPDRPIFFRNVKNKNRFTSQKGKYFNLQHTILFY